MIPASNIVPILETERLVLRGIEQRDHKPFAAFYATEATSFVGGPMSSELAWRKLAGYAGGWLLRGFGQFAVEEKSTGDFVGVVGPYHPEGWPEPEIAWSIVTDFQGKGYAKEAALRSLRYAYEDLGWQKACSCIDAENTPSIRLAESLGAVCEGETEIRPFGPALLYRHKSPAEILGSNHLGSAA
ncbi:MAG: GNAT family N-acetyltransferase [Rhizobiaceae bacterium]